MFYARSLQAAVSRRFVETAALDDWPPVLAILTDMERVWREVHFWRQHGPDSAETLPSGGPDWGYVEKWSAELVGIEEFPDALRSVKETGDDEEGIGWEVVTEAADLGLNLEWALDLHQKEPAPVVLEALRVPVPAPRFARIPPSVPLENVRPLDELTRDATNYQERGV